MTVVGADVLLREQLDLLRGRRVGLITNPTGVTGDLESLVDVFHQHPAIHLQALFSPEHGLHANVQDGKPVPSDRDGRTRLPVHSLYGATQRPTPEMLDGLDVLVYDIQDVGVRFYTYIWTMALAMEGTAEAGLPFLVLDRPNPISGVAVSGPVLEDGFSSFVGLYPIALRYGLTTGELAWLLNDAFGIGADLTVVQLKGWHRDQWYDETGLVWVPPSPAMPTLETAALYPGTCLLEGTNLSEGRGTAKPFEWIGAPWMDGNRLAATLNALELVGVCFRSIAFRPTAGKYAGQICFGVHIHLLDRRTANPLAVALHLIAAAKTQHPDHFAWRQPGRQDGRYHFDMLVGTDQVRLGIEAGAAVPEIMASWEPDLARFCELRLGYLLY